MSDMEQEALFKLAYLVDGFLGSDAEGNHGDAKEWKRHMRNWMEENDWLQWQQAARAQGGEAVADFDAWWDNKARYHDHRSTKALARAAYKQGFSDGYTYPNASVTE